MVMLLLIMKITIHKYNQAYQVYYDIPVKVIIIISGYVGK